MDQQSPTSNPDAGNELESYRIKQWLEELSPAIARLTALMDSKETWVEEPDHEFIDLLSQVAERVEQPEFVMALEGELSREVAQLFALLRSSRFLRLLEMFDRRSPGLASRLVFILGRLGGESQVYADLFCERLMVLHRFELLSSVFSVRRCQAITSAIRIIKEVEA